jgi:DNA polymerase III gamma/tau subunit
MSGSMSNLITRYRPQSFDEVSGHAAVVRSLKEVCKKKDARVFLFSGPKGVGKTTFAYLVAQAYGCSDILDNNAATKNGIDDMREIQESLQYKSFGTDGQRAVIIDECHGLSKQAWDSLLKVLEETPQHVVWCLCTTNPSKIPETVKSRCASYQLDLLSDAVLGDLYDFVCEEEKINISEEVADIIIREAKGSPRQLLSNIVVARSAKNKKEAAQLLKTAVETDNIIELARLVAKGGFSWTSCMDIVKKLEKSEQPESVRIVVMNYLGACLKNAKDDKAAIVFLQKMEAFSTPYVGNEGLAPLLLSIGRSLFA